MISGTLLRYETVTNSILENNSINRIPLQNEIFKVFEVITKIRKKKDGPEMLDAVYEMLRKLVSDGVPFKQEIQNNVMVTYLLC